MVAGFLVAAGSVMAQDLTLTKIGQVSMIGVDYSTVNFSGAIPTLEGTASPAAEVLIQIKTSTTATTAASPSGVWKFTPGVLDLGSSAIVISSGQQSISFNLIFNATPSATPTATVSSVPSELPAAGVWEYYLPVLGLGIGVLFLSKYLKRGMQSWEGRGKW